MAAIHLERKGIPNLGDRAETELALTDRGVYRRETPRGAKSAHQRDRGISGSSQQKPTSLDDAGRRDARVPHDVPHAVGARRPAIEEMDVARLAEDGLTP